MIDNAKSRISRRDFAKVSAAAGFAVLRAKSGVAETNTDTLKAGLLGCGNRGSGACVNLLEGNDNVKLIAMADLFEDRLQGSLEAFRNHENPAVRSKCEVNPDHCFLGFDAYKQILATDIDILIEGTLPYCRPKHIEAAVEAKKHIFSEKPAATDPPGVRRILAAADKHKQMGLSFVAGTQRRHSPDYIETVKKIRDGAVGDIIALRAYWCSGLPFVFPRKPGWGDFEYRIRNWYANCWVAGDNIVEQHVHNIDVCNWVMGGPPKRVFASGGRTWKPRTEEYGDIYDHFSCDFEYENGVHLFSFSRHWNNVSDAVFEQVIGTKGTSDCRDMGPAGRSPYVQEHIDLVNSIRGTGPYCHEGRQMAESTMTAMMGRMAAYTGMMQTYSKALNEDLSLVPEVWSLDRAYPVGPIPAPGA